jgi:hypothetical protein
MAFASAVHNSSNYTTGAKGAGMKKTSGDYRVDCFTNFSKDTPEDKIRSGVQKMIGDAGFIQGEDKGQYIADVFKLWAHKRHAREGEKEKLLAYRYFLVLYDHFPKTCIQIVSERLFGEIGYWKDHLLIWGLIMDMEMTDHARFNKYDPLIEAFRDTYLAQRADDLKVLDDFVTPHSIRNITTEKLEALWDAKVMSGAKLPQLTFVGKYCVRERSAENKHLYWFIQSPDGSLKKQSHVAYMIRGSLKIRNRSNGTYEKFPSEKDVPFGAKKAWRTLNAKLNVALDVPEVKACAQRFGDMDPTKFPSQFSIRNSKALLNEKLKIKPTEYEEETGNRHPDDEDRVALRKKMREMFTDPSKMNADQIFPHIIANKATKASSTAMSDMQQALWDAKVKSGLERLEETRQKIAAELKAAGAADERINSALASGNIIGCADVSASMTWVDNEPNRPLDIAMGLVCFISQIASPAFRDVALSFTTQPKTFSFKHPSGRPMTVKERMGEISKNNGGSTNYKGLHEECLRLCNANNVPKDEEFVIYVATDGDFDSMDNSMNPARSYYSFSGRRNVSDQKNVPNTHPWVTAHAQLEKMWKDAGRRMPIIVYHNLNSISNGVQEDITRKGVILLSGRSDTVIKYVLYGECAEETTKIVDGVEVKVRDIDPYTIFRKAMDDDHHEHLDNILRASSEGILTHYN